MRGAWLLVFAVGCGGSKDPTTDDTGAGDDDDDAPILIDCTDIPTYELDTLDCPQLGNAFENTMDDASLCNSDTDCVVVSPECSHWNDVSCHYAANYCVTQDPTIVQGFNQAASGCGGDDVCVCGPQPPVTCVDHRCTLGDTTLSR